MLIHAKILLIQIELQWLALLYCYSYDENEIDLERDDWFVKQSSVSAKQGGNTSFCAFSPCSLLP